jgi:tetratricopeptide (TPR) repeat protein
MFFAVAVVLLFANTAIASDTVPITTKSEAARREYLTGRDLNERLRGAEAVEHFRKAIELDPSFASAHLALALVAPTPSEFESELARAVSHSTAASEGERLTIRAAESGNGGRPLAARETLQKVVKLYPADARSHFALGLNYMGQQEYPAAIEALSKAIAADPAFSPPYNQRGYAYRFNHDPVRAESDFKTYIRLLPGDPNPYDSYAEFLLSRGRYEESIQNYRKALDLRKDFVPSNLGIAADLTYLGRFDDARKELDAYMKNARNDGQRVFGHWQTAAVYLNEGKYAEAAASIDRARALNRGLGDPLAEYFDTLQQGTIWLEAGDLNKADATWKESEALLGKAKMQESARDINHLVLDSNHVRLLIRKGQLSEAKSLLSKYKKGMSERGNVAGERRAAELAAEIALAEKRWDDAVQQLANGTPNNPYDVYLTGYALEQKGNHQSAATKFKETLEANQLLSLNYGFVRPKAMSSATRLAAKTKS